MIRRKKRKLVCGKEDRSWCGLGRTRMGVDFVDDEVERGPTIRVLSVVDAYTRECLALEVNTIFASRRVPRELEAIIAERGVPSAIRCDNGTELTIRHFLAVSRSGKSS